MLPPDLLPELAEFYALFEHCNQTELYQLARRAGHVVMPTLSRDQLIRILIDAEEPPFLEVHTIDEWRRALMRFLIQHRAALETQLTCPARSFQEDACFGCADAQVVSCLIDNKKYIPLIQLHRKK